MMKTTKLTVLKATIAGVALSCMATISLADEVKKRQAAMDQIRVGAATLVPMLKKQKDFDAQIAELALRMTYAGALAFEGKFPEGSSSKGANPAIWENKADFDAKLLDFISSAETAAAAKPADLEALRTAYQPLLEDCAACHKAYRIKD